jgi:hypothetical protein
VNGIAENQQWDRKMKLIHYTRQEFQLEPREYDQNEMQWNAKPNGFWFSVEEVVEEDQTWKTWCEGADYELEDLVISYQIELKENANILHLKTDEEILNFSKLFPYIEHHRICRSFELDWPKVKKNIRELL